MPDEHSNTGDPAVGSTRLLAECRARYERTLEIYEEAKASPENKRSGWTAMMQGQLAVWNEVIALVTANSMFGPKSPDQRAVPLVPMLSCANFDGAGSALSTG